MSYNWYEISRRIYVGFCLIGLSVSLVTWLVGWSTISFWALISVLISFILLAAVTVALALAGLAVLVIKRAVDFVLYGEK
jgi:hypothetical protein